MASNSALLPAKDQGWLQGYTNLASNENRAWWKTRTWLVQVLIWMAIINGLLFAVLYTASREDAARTEVRQDLAAQSMADVGLTLFFTFVTLAPGLGVAIIGQDAIIQEKQTGTAAWILSKPVSRSAFILSKLLANALGILVTMVLVQGAAAYLLITKLGGAVPSARGFAAGLALAYLGLCFHLALSFMLGTLFSSRGAVIGIGMILLFGYQLVLGIAPWLGAVGPWNLTLDLGNDKPALAIALASGQSLPTFVPVIATLLWCVLFVGVALWRFNREEF